jgi:Fe2+ or Zn2+ uptake regulation protein
MKEIVDSIRAAGMRLTAPRQAIIQVLVEAEDWQTPEEIHLRACKLYPSLGLVTVYRTLSLLSDLGFVRRIHLEQGCHGYVRTELGHGHHVVCRNCRQTVEFPGLKEFSFLIERISDSTGYLVQEHMLELLGLCPECQVNST